MSKYKVEIWQQVSRFATVEVEAEHRDDAKEIAWEMLDKGEITFDEKVSDTDTYANEIQINDKEKEKI
jgi:hypothetical protein